MLIHLVRKDFLIVKKYVLLMLAVCVIIPPFMMWRTDAAYVGAMSFVLSAIFSVFMLLQYVSSKENQYAKASTLLCATPYPRKLIVLSKYVFCLLIYGVCCLIFWTEALIFPVLGGFHIEIAASAFISRYNISWDMKQQNLLSLSLLWLLHLLCHNYLKCRVVQIIILWSPYHQHLCPSELF